MDKMLINIDEHIKETLSKTELSIINYINNREKHISSMSIVDIAFETFTSPSTVSRAIIYFLLLFNLILQLTKNIQRKVVYSNALVISFPNIVPSQNTFRTQYLLNSAASFIHYPSVRIITVII